MSGPLAKRGLVVLDRDGVINQDSKAFVKSAEEWLPLPGSIEAIARLSTAGFSVAVASNQSGLARGLFADKALEAMNQKLFDLVDEAGGRVDQVVYCTHGPNDDCDCRKPRPGLLYQLGEHFAVDIAGVPVIGDSLRDLQAAVAASARPILVLTGNGRETAASLPAGLADVEIYENLSAAVAALLEE